MRCASAAERQELFASLLRRIPIPLSKREVREVCGAGSRSSFAAARLQAACSHPYPRPNLAQITMYTMLMRSLRTLLSLALLTVLTGCASSPMARAIQGGRTSEALALLDQGYDLDAKIGKGQLTPLELAVTYHRADIVKALLDRGADVNIRRHGTSALSLAALDGDPEMVALLLSKGAEATERDIKWAQGPHRAEIAELFKKAVRDNPSPSSAAPVSAAQSSVSTASFSLDVLPSYRVGEHPNDFALVIGIGKYMDAPEARFSEEDAGLVREHLVALGWPSRNIIALTGALAGRAGISKYLERWLPNNVTENSRMFFYFAGNGAADPKTRRAYLLPWDGDADLLEATGYPLVRLYEKLNALKAKETLAVIDAGFAGAGPRSAPPKSARTPVERPGIVEAGDTGDVVALLAASESETAGVLEGKRSGALTHCFLKGLNDGGLDADKIVTIKGLFRYVRSAVGEAARGENRVQTPRLFTGSLGEADMRLR